MSDNLWNSKKNIRHLLEEAGLTLKKRFGQNFLIDPVHRQKIVTALELEEGDKVWEIGPGIGSITHKLLDCDCRLTVFEIDYGLVRLLRNLFRKELAEGRLEIIEGDFLATWRDVLKDNGPPDKLVGNLPYSTGSLMVGVLLEEDLLPRSAVFTLQKDVALRMGARSGTRDYSAFSLVCQLRARIERIGDIGGGAFFPPPQVVSSIVRLHRREDSPSGAFPLYFELVHDLFRSRRKTAANNLKAGTLSARLGWETVMDASTTAGIDLSRRGETFTRDEVLKFAMALASGAAV